MIGVKVEEIEREAAWRPPFTSIKKFFVGSGVVDFVRVGGGGVWGGGVCVGGGVCSVGGVCVGGGVCPVEGVAPVTTRAATSHNMHVVFVIELLVELFWDAQRS